MSKGEHSPTSRHRSRGVTHVRGHHPPWGQTNNSQNQQQSRILIGLWAHNQASVQQCPDLTSEVTTLQTQHVGHTSCCLQAEHLPQVAHAAPPSSPKAAARQQDSALKHAVLIAASNTHFSCIMCIWARSTHTPSLAILARVGFGHRHCSNGQQHKQHRLNCWKLLLPVSESVS